jgi:Icc-related predicted phosphoesterase
VRILAVSDVVDPALQERFQPKRYRDVKLILACGDLAPEYLGALAHRVGAPLYYVMGNHDIRESDYPPPGCMDLNARVVRLQGLTLAGLEGSMWYNGGPHQYEEKQMQKKARELGGRIRRTRRPLDIVITHAPPRGIHDGEDLCHQGFEAFRWLIRKFAPRFFLHGHIHRRFDTDAERVTEVDRTKVINAYGHHLLDIEDEKDSG